MAATGYTEWMFQLFNNRTRTYISDSTGLCKVMTENSPVSITIYSDDRGTTATNAITFTSGTVRFFTADTVLSVDLSILTANSHAFFIESATPSMKRIDVDPERMLQKLVLPYLVVGASEVNVNTGFSLAANMLVKDIEIDVQTVGTGGVLLVGTSLANTGFANGVLVGTTGFPISVLEEALVSTSSLFGSLLALGTGTSVRKKHVRANATSGASIVYQNTTSSSTAGNGYIYLTFDRMATR